ncbi:MAG TPA: SUMF1/EgtB/PvdO family nonheme iron enzyme [Polyangiaceae bacterium]|nr:SUMF1/EgtB/PvdO family nonheme iron enzyme [Polyangiaceae bacterium]
MPSASERVPASESFLEPGDEYAAELVRRVLLGELSPEQACEQGQISPEQLTEWIRVHRRAVRRAIDEQISSTLSAQGLQREDFTLSGNLETMALADLLETVQLGRKDAYIRIEHDGDFAHLWCIDGDVIDARIGLAVGSPAVYELLALTEGRLQVDFSPVAHERTILATTQELLVEHARRSDELERVRGQLGDPARVLWQSTGENTVSGLAPRELAALRAFDGRRSIADVVATLRRPELETLTAIHRLLQSGALLAAPAQPAEADAAESAPAVQRAARPGYASRAPASREAPPSRASLPASSRASVPPIAPSVVTRRSVPAPARRYAPFALGAAGMLAAFAAGLWVARPAPAPAPQPAAAARPSLEALETALCGSGMKLFTSATPPRPGTAAARAPIAPFCLARSSVTADEYRACVSSQNCAPAQTETQAENTGGREAPRCSFGAPGRGTSPINCITQRQAEQYCEWRGQRLPMPDEWEVAWQSAHAAPGAGSGASWIGDLSEWTKDRADRPQRANAAGQEPQLYAVMRVDNAVNSGSNTAAPSRLYVAASAHARGIGFRCALSLQTSPTR